MSCGGAEFPRFGRKISAKIGVSKFLGVCLVCSGGNKERSWLGTQEGTCTLAFFSKTLSEPPTRRVRNPQISGSEKGVFWKRGLFSKVHFLEILENLEILEFLENPQTVEKEGESDHFLEILENLEILEILEIPPVKRPLS